ncbi:kinase-like domain-containing protein [Pelagophyceae sp. CCMP2097]|nr:kinase-like domain-containing protein [Pelagophyceae sp. CCMP2097]
MGAEISSCFLCFDSELPKAETHRYTRFEHLQLDKELGHGAYSTVRLAINTTNKDKFAVKVIQKAKLRKGEIDALHAEVGILSKLSHPHIVQYFDFTQDRSHYYIVLEVVAGGELFDRIVQRVHYSEKEARDVVWVILDVVHHLHSKHIAHRDIKPENLLLKSAHNDHDVKLADFGFATDARMPLRSLCGTPSYVAPEIVSEKAYGLECDLWSVGVVVFILLGGYQPFDDSEGMPALYEAIKAGTFTFDERYWANVSAEAKSLIKSLLQVNPAKRTSAAAMNHEWFTKHADELATDLKVNVVNMKKWNARRKLKGGVKAVMAANRVDHLLGH